MGVSHTMLNIVKCGDGDIIGTVTEYYPFKNGKMAAFIRHVGREDLLHSSIFQ